MTDTDMIEAMARAMEGHGSLQGAAAAALAVVQPEIDRLRKERDDLSGELSIWKSVFPDIAPRNVLPDRSNLEYELDRLRAENARLRSALEPFASRAGRYDPVDNDDGEPDWSTAAPSIRIGDLRRARAALSPSRADGEGR